MVSSSILKGWTASNGLKQNLTAPDGTVYEYAYGTSNELREISIPNLGAIGFAEYQWTRPARIVYPGGMTRELEYDGLMRLTHLTSTAPGGNILLDYAYEYDNSGNIMSKQTEHGDYSYDYDSASRLTSADNPVGDDESYAYDAVGNRTSASNAEGEIAHNANNELERYGELEYEYDDNGNMTEVILSGQVVFVYHYNADNRLIKVEGGNNNTIAEYYYDPFGRRLWKDVSGVRTYFFYSDEGLMAEFDLTGSEVRSYGYTPDSTWTTDPMWMRYNHAYYFYQNDHLGTPQKLTAQNGMVAWSASYSAFGEATVDTEFITNNLRFPGQYYDEETGLHYNFQRYYDPEIGRYISVDPIGFLGGSHLFIYSKNNPLKLYDTSGLYPCSPRHGSMIPPEKSVWLISHLQEQADQHLETLMRQTNNYSEVAVLSWTRNRNRLNFIGSFGKSLGVIGHQQTNKFVYTCKYGWIDHAHFFNNARMVYQFGLTVPGAEFLSWAKEEQQVVTGNSSGYSPEDLVSNWQGREFATEMLNYERVNQPTYVLLPPVELGVMSRSAFFDIAQHWEQFLKDAGAVKWGTLENGQHVKALLDSECQRFLDDQKADREKMIEIGSTIAGCLAYQKSQPERECLCDGDRPKNEELAF